MRDGRADQRETTPVALPSGERPDERAAGEGLAPWPFEEPTALPDITPTKEVTPPSTGNAPLVPSEGTARDRPDQRKGKNSDEFDS